MTIVQVVFDSKYIFEFDENLVGSNIIDNLIDISECKEDFEMNLMLDDIDWDYYNDQV